MCKEEIRLTWRIRKKNAIYLAYLRYDDKVLEMLFSTAVPRHYAIAFKMQCLPATPNLLSADAWCTGTWCSRMYTMKLSQRGDFIKYVKALVGAWPSVDEHLHAGVPIYAMNFLMLLNIFFLNSSSVNACLLSFLFANYFLSIVATFILIILLLGLQATRLALPIF